MAPLTAPQHVDLTGQIGQRLRLRMVADVKWKGAELVGTIRRAPEGAPPGSVTLEHRYAGDVVLLPGSVVSWKVAPKR